MTDAALAIWTECEKVPNIGAEIIRRAAGLKLKNFSSNIWQSTKRVQRCERNIPKFLKRKLKLDPGCQKGNYAAAATTSEHRLARSGLVRNWGQSAFVKLLKVPAPQAQLSGSPSLEKAWTNF